jgi:sigma-B regulation protein RsbU (phosphoserine phosphatase)
MGEIELERTNEFLQAKLNAERERTRMALDVTARLAAEPADGRLMDHLLGLAIGPQADVRACLWVLEDDRLRPAAARNAPALVPRPAGSGLLGQVVATGRPAVTPGPAAAAVAPEPELAGAAGAAVLPLAGRSGVLGAMAVWSPREAFDAAAVKHLETVAFLAAAALENDRLRRTALASERLRQDVEIASRIQQTLLLGTPPVDLKKATAAAQTTPSLQIGGDFYDFFAYDQALDVVIGDVMGKGVTAALVGAATKNHIVRAANYLFAARPGRLPEPREILSVVSAELFHQLARIECFVTLCYARFDLARQRVEFIDCGHPSTIHARSGGGHALLKGENMPLGFGPGEVYRQTSAPFESGDVFFFYSDGLTEARGPGGEYFGAERLARVVESFGWLSPRELVKKAQQEVRAFAGEGAGADDLTCVAVKIGDIQATLASTRATLEVASDPAELPRVRAFLREQYARHANPAAVAGGLAELEQAAAEVGGAVINQAYYGRRDGTIRYEAEVFAGRFVVRAYYHGPQVDPDVTGTVYASDLGAVGGLAAARRLVDALKCSRGKHGENCVYLEKWLREGPAKGG